MDSTTAASADAHEQAPVDNGRCFACGPDNPIGLQLVFHATRDESVVEAETILGDRFQGWEGFAHGGMICTLLDEAMAHAGAFAGRSVVTAGIRVRFRRPTPLGKALTVRGWIAERRSRVLRMAAEVRDEANVLLASAEGDFLDRGELDPNTLIARIRDAARVEDVSA